MSLERIDSRFGDAMQKILYQDGKVGGTSGWTVRAAADSFLCTVAASQTAGTLVIPLTGLKVGDRIDGYNLLGQIESAGNTVTLDAALYKTSAAAADVSTAVVSGTSMTQISVTADTKIDKLNATKTFNDANQTTVGEGESYFLLLTATTGASTDIALMGAQLHVTPAV